MQFLVKNEESKKKHFFFVHFCIVFLLTNKNKPFKFLSVSISPVSGHYRAGVGVGVCVRTRANESVSFLIRKPKYK